MEATMKNALLALVLAFGLISCKSAEKNPVSDGYTWYEVERIVDGDTLVLNQIGKVRLIGVDTPETKDPRKPVQYFGKEATQFLNRLVQHEEVRVEYDQSKQDRFQRTLAYVYLKNGTFVNAEIIKQGYGHAYTKFPFKHLEEFRKLEKEAREDQRGLWAPRKD